MIHYILRRILIFVPVLLCIILLTFVLVHNAPGSPFAAEKHISAETLAALEKQYGLDLPLYKQILLYLKNVAHGNLGLSMNYNDRTVNEIIFQALPVSMRLGAFALALAILFGVLSGVLSAYKRNTAVDHATMGVAMIGISVPPFVLASFMILVFSFYIRLFPAVGWVGPRSMILPALTLAAPYVAYISRITRASLIEVLSQDYITAARAKGVAERPLVFTHALKNGLIPVISFLGPAAAYVLTGSVVVEKIFAIPGLGVNFVHSALHRDYFLAVGCALVYGVVLMCFNLLSDVLYGLVDPRIRYEK
jgi:oligopeptide transport system permease protein